MRILLLLLLLWNFTLVIAQSENSSFRQITGVLVDENKRPFPGQNVIILGTTIGTQTDLEGKFCLTIPTNFDVFISLPFCFDQITRRISTYDSYLFLKIGKGKRKSRKAINQWNLMSAKEKNKLTSFFNSNVYITAQKSYCQSN
ncbi:hypothetical protein [Dokdonia sp. R86516]|uniref:hypothetical protein n=1 Tax=Dokdonia sp. R86516 TaxID=3093856 RepID=UPI0037C8AAAC